MAPFGCELGSLLTRPKQLICKDGHTSLFATWLRLGPPKSKIKNPNGPFGFWVLDFLFWISDFGFWISDFGFLILELDFGFCILDFGFGISDFGFWILDCCSIRSFCGSPKRGRLDFGFWMILGFGFWVSDFGFRFLDFGFRILDFVHGFDFAKNYGYYAPARVGG